MNTNLPSTVVSTRSISSEGWAGIAGAVGSVFLLARKLLSPKPASKPDWVTRSEFYAEMLGLRERINAKHLAVLEKMDTNHRELMASLERLSGRISALEAGLARVDERTRRGAG